MIGAEFGRTPAGPVNLPATHDQKDISFPARYDVVEW